MLIDHVVRDNMSHHLQKIRINSMWIMKQLFFFLYTEEKRLIHIKLRNKKTCQWGDQHIMQHAVSKVVSLFRGIKGKHSPNYLHKSYLL